MFSGGIGIWELLVVLVIIALLFGTKKLRNIGGDLGSAIKSFKSAMGEGEHHKDDDDSKHRVIENDDQADSKESSESRREKDSSS